MKYAPIAVALIVPLALLGACANFGASSRVASQAAEKADLAAADTYVAIATSLNAYEGVAGANVAGAEALKLAAWKAFSTEQQVYAAAHTVDLSALTGVAAQVHTLTGH
jgi:hypothetical protein